MTVCCRRGNGISSFPQQFSAMTETVVVSEWDSDRFHQRVMELEAQGYVARRDTYRIIAEMNPETGIVSHVHSMELYRPDTEKP
jgi:hypothetical protein